MWATAMVNSVSAAASLIGSPRQDRHHSLRQAQLASHRDGRDGVGRRDDRAQHQRRDEGQRHEDHHDETAATANAVTTTSPTPRPRIGRMLRRNVGYEKSSAAEYSSGGSTTVSRMCESSSGRPELRQE